MNSFQLQANVLSLTVEKFLMDLEAIRRDKSELDEKSLRREREDFDEYQDTLRRIQASSTSDSGKRGTKRRLTTEEEGEGKEAEEDEEIEDNVCSPSKK